MLFTKGLEETLKLDFNPDEINFMYIYAGSQKHVIPDVDSKTVWSLNVMSQTILPKKINLTVNYSTTTAGGNYFYYIVKSPLYQELGVTLSKKFLSDNLSVSLYANDILNTNKQDYGSMGTNLLYTNKYDSRRVGFSLSYKLPTKNKLAEEAHILSNDKPQEENKIGN